MSKRVLEIANHVFAIEADAVSNALTLIDSDALTSVVTLLKDAQRIAACGCGHSGIACQHFAHLMCCIERPARFIAPATATHGALGYLQMNDVMLLASRGGKSKELFPILEICKKRDVRVITVTEVVSSPLAQKADVVLKMCFGREADRYNSQGTTSFTIMSVLFDALQCALIEEMGFQNEQFASIHPGGAVGERLNC